MEAVIEFFTPLQAWHWAALGLVILGFELALGTIDLLWIAAAAFLTALFKAIMPAPIDGLEGQLLFFAVTAVGLLVLGRTVFGDWRNRENDKPMLNKRMESMVRSRALVTQAFAAGTGRVKIGDTEWLAHAVDGEDFAKGATVIIKDVEATAVKVSKA